MKYAYYFLKTKAKTNLYSYKLYMSRATEKKYECDKIKA